MCSAECTHLEPSDFTGIHEFLRFLESIGLGLPQGTADTTCLAMLLYSNVVMLPHMFKHDYRFRLTS
jgi:hypothetical protein